MLFTSEEKNLMIGAFTAGGLQTVFDAYFGYKLGSGVNIANTPSDPAYWLYKPYLTNWIPAVNQLIAWFAVPGLMYWLGKRKPKMRTMGLGGLIYGVSELIGTTAFKVTALATGQPMALSYRVIGVRA